MCQQIITEKSVTCEAFESIVRQFELMFALPLYLKLPKNNYVDEVVVNFQWSVVRKPDQLQCCRPGTSLLLIGTRCISL